MKVIAPLVAALALLAAPAAAQEDRDVQARDLFVAGKYDQALDMYRALHQSTGHPTYLRNIGRCHQMMRQPAPAIASFRAYLREARPLEAAERREIEGYIAEMEALSAPPPASLAVPPAQAPPAPPGVALVEPRGAAAEPVTRKWWFWTGVGALVAGAVVTALVIGGSQGSNRPPCPAGAICPP